MIKVDEIERIRRAYYIEKKTIRQIARELNHGRQVVRQAIASAEPSQYTLKQPRSAPVLGPYKARIDELLAENETMPRKQQYTWHKIYELIQQDGYQGSGSNLRHYIGQRRAEKRRPAVYLPLEFDPGTDGQVDWGEAEVIMQGERVTVQLFVLRLCYSRRLFVMAFPRQEQSAFFEGHVQAFHFLGGIPQRLTYDNLKAAVQRVLVGRNRQEQHSFIAFRSHYLFESNFCTPGQGHDTPSGAPKGEGGVEHGVGYARRNFLVPLPQVDSFAELNAYLLACCQREDQRQVAGQSQTIGAAWQQEQAHLRALPATDVACCQIKPVSLTPYSQVIIDTNRYSVPADQVVKEFIAKIYPFRVEIFRPGDKTALASHPRCYGHQQDVFGPHHYLPLLLQRPGAFAYAKPLRRWREKWPPVFEQLLSQLQTTWPEGRGLREFIRVLNLHRQYPAELIEQAVSQALRYHCAHADGVELCLRELSRSEPATTPLDLSDRPHLAEVGGRLAPIAQYDRLLEVAP